MFHRIAGPSQRGDRRGCRAVLRPVYGGLRWEICPIAAVFAPNMLIVTNIIGDNVAYYIRGT